MLTHTALTHGSTEGHGKATSVLHFIGKSSCTSTLPVPPLYRLLCYTQDNGHTHTKSILKLHRTKNGFINNVFCLLKLKLMG